MGHKKQILIITFFLLLFSVIAIAQPIFSTSRLVTKSGFDIEISTFEFVRVNQGLNITVHVINQTNGMPIIENVVCEFHLFNKSQESLMTQKQNKTGNDLEFMFNVPASNLSAVGEYNFHLFCNSSVAGGFLAKNFFATKSGENLDLDHTLLIFGVFLGLIIVIFSISFFLVWLTRQIGDDNVILVGFKVLCIGFALFMILYAASLAIPLTKLGTEASEFLIVSESFIIMNNLSEKIFKAVTWIIRILIIFIFIYLLWVMVMFFKKPLDDSKNPKNFEPL